MGSGHVQSFDMFSARASFSDRFVLIAAERSHVDPMDVYSALVAGIMTRAIEVTASIMQADDAGNFPTVSNEDALRGMSDALKYVIRMLEHASDEWVGETVDNVLDFVDDLMEEDGAESTGAIGDGDGDGECEDDDCDEVGELSVDEIRELEKQIGEAVEAWDTWEPTDEILLSLKESFAASFDKAVERIHSADTGDAL